MGRSREQFRRPDVSSDMTTLGLIGSGNIGSQLARAAIGIGYDVVNPRGGRHATLYSQDPSNSAETVRV